MVFGNEGGQKRRKRIKEGIYIENIIITESISANDFCRLREAVNFQHLTTEQAEKILKNTFYTASAVCSGKYIGLTRLLFNYGTDAYITDVIVDPKFQGFGVGKMLIENVLEFIKSNSQKGTSVACSLYANKGKENFYGKFGFEELPNEKYGYGMIIEL